MTGKEIREKLLNEVRKLSDEDEYFTSEEFAMKHGYKEATIRQMLKRGQISSAVKVNGRWYISENADVLVKQYTKRNKYVL